MSTTMVSEWKAIRVVDAFADGPEMVKCERCNHRLRWIHILQSDSGEYARVGVCCAAKISGAYDARSAERDAVNRYNRLQTFLKPEAWKISRNNPANVWRKVILADRVSVLVTVFLKNGSYGVFLALPGGKDNVTPYDRFSSQDTAKAFAFECVDRLKSSAAR